MKIGSYALAVAGDGLAWLTAGIFSIILYLFVLKHIRKSFAAAHHSEA
jgi:hypothetical protein